MASVPFAVKADHWKNWSVAELVAEVSCRGSVVVPVNVAPPSCETLTRMSLLQAPGVFTPVYLLLPDAAKPAGVQPFDSFECLLMYEPKVTTTWELLPGRTWPDGELAARETEF